MTLELIGFIIYAVGTLIFMWYTLKRFGGLETYQTDLNKRFELMCKDVLKLQSKKKK